MKLHLANNLAQCQKILQKYDGELSELVEYEQFLAQQLSPQKSIYCEGFSWPIQKTTQFLIDKQYGQNDQINWRERLVCIETQFNNRIRGALHVFEQVCKPTPKDKIYLTEQHTVLYKWLKKHYKNTVGSEYLTDSSWFNQLKFKIRLFPDKLIHQDLTKLTEPGDSFNYAMSFDCLEHIADYQSALAELARVIKPGGQLLFSVPFDLGAQNTLVRASVNADFSITHHTEPEYHGNPVSKQGSLSFYTFGWDLMDALKAAGFKNAYGILYWSKTCAYLGGPQLLLCAEN